MSIKALKIDDTALDDFSLSDHRPINAVMRRRWQWDALKDHVVWEPNGRSLGPNFDEENEVKVPYMPYFPKKLDQTKRIKVDVLAAGEVWHVLEMVDCAGNIAYVVRDGLMVAKEFDTEEEAMVEYQKQEAHIAELIESLGG